MVNKVNKTLTVLVTCRMNALALIFAAVIMSFLTLQEGRADEPEEREMIYSTSFAKGEWDRDDWVQVKSARWDAKHGWVQHDGYIENKRPEDAPDDRLLGGSRTYASMVLRERVDTAGGVKVRSTMEFHYEQAPQIVIAADLGECEKGRNEHREHYEVVLFDQGVNIWHHTYEDAEAKFRLVAFSRFDLENQTPYTMSVMLDRTRSDHEDPEAGRLMTVEVEGQTFAYFSPHLPTEVYVGIIGCYSANRFYDFSVERMP